MTHGTRNDFAHHSLSVGSKKETEVARTLFLRKSSRGIVCHNSFVTAPFFIIVRRRPGLKVLFCHHSSSSTPHLLCTFCTTLATDLIIPSLGACLPRNGREIAYIIALSTTSRYFLILCSRPRLLFSSVGAENYNRLHCTTHGTLIL